MEAATHWAHGFVIQATVTKEHEDQHRGVEIWSSRQEFITKYKIDIKIHILSNLKIQVFVFTQSRHGCSCRSKHSTLQLSSSFLMPSSISVKFLSLQHRNYRKNKTQNFYISVFQISILARFRSFQNSFRQFWTRLEVLATRLSFPKTFRGSV